MGWLPQEHERTPGESVAGYVARRTGCARATADLDAAATALEHDAPPGGPDPADVYAAALEKAGVEFTNGTRSGVRLVGERRPKPTTRQSP